MLSRDPKVTRHFGSLVYVENHNFRRTIMKLKLTLTALLATSAPAFAVGDVEKGEAVFKTCQTCHIVADPDGNVLAGKASKTGPNLYAVVGRPAGTYEGFKYGDDMIAAGAAGLVWNEAELDVYIQDPSAFLKDYLNDKGAKGKMQFKVKKEEDAINVIAYIMSLSPELEPAAVDGAAVTDPAAIDPIVVPAAKPTP